MAPPGPGADMSRLEAVSDLHPGDAVGPYRVEARLGEGGMGLVYKATDGEGRTVALKLVRGELAADAVYRKRFDREARTAERVTHPHLVPVLGTGEHEGVPYMVQEYIDGGTLQHRLDREGQLPLEAAVTFCLQVAKGLGALHAEHLVHRDLKPSNILIDEQDCAFITDFGLTKDRDASVLTTPGKTVGSLDYMAPEQIRGEEVVAATDVYSLGCVVFQCLSGAPPFAHFEGMQVLWAHMREEPADPCADRDDAPDGLGWAVTRALEKDVGKRPPTPTAYARMVQVAAGVPPLSPRGN